MVTSSNPNTRFTTEVIGFIVNLFFPILDKFYPEVSTEGQAATVTAALEQKRERKADI